MKNDTLIKSEGMDALFDKLGIVDAERFITLMSKESFDYTKWQKTCMRIYQWKKSVKSHIIFVANKKMCKTCKENIIL